METQENTSVLQYQPIQLENFSPYNELNNEKSITTIIVRIKRQIKLLCPLNQSYIRNVSEWEVSPKELACLVSKLNVDTAASAEVFSHYGDFSASRLWTSARGQACDSWSLQNRQMQRKKVVKIDLRAS